MLAVQNSEYRCAKRSSQTSFGPTIRQSTMSVNISRLERGMDGRVWRAYMAGRHAARRDDDMGKARKASDPVIRSMHARHAREEHRYYLKSARAAQPDQP